MLALGECYKLAASGSGANERKPHLLYKHAQYVHVTQYCTLFQVSKESFGDPGRWVHWVHGKQEDVRINVEEKCTRIRTIRNWKTEEQSKWWKVESSKGLGYLGETIWPDVNSVTNKPWAQQLISGSVCFDMKLCDCFSYLKGGKKSKYNWEQFLN